MSEIPEMRETPASVGTPSTDPIRRVARHARWHEPQAQMVVSAWKQSGLSMRVFAEKLGIRAKRLERWAAKLRHHTHDVAKPPVRFLPVAIDAEATTVEVTAANHGDDVMEVRLRSGVWVSVRPGFDGPSFRRLLDVLGC